MKVIVIWYEDGGKYLRALGYGDGTPRVYDRDRLDPRLGQLPYVETIEELLTTRPEGPDGATQVPAKFATAFMAAKFATAFM